MHKRSSKPPKDPNQLAAFIVAQSTAELHEDAQRVTRSTGTSEKNPDAVALGRLGGKVGGKARAEKLSAQRRREIAQGAAKQRWARNKAEPH